MRAVRERPAVIAEAIFPIIGAAINRAMREALSRMMQQTTYALEHAFSLRSWRWRLEARATGAVSEVVLLHSLVYRVEQVFLIHPESGLLLQHVHADMPQASVEESIELQNATMVSSMLTAIQDFVRDSFRTDSKRRSTPSRWVRSRCGSSAGRTRLGQRHSRHSTGSLRGVLRDALAQCHRDHLDKLKAFSGDPNELQGVRPYLLACLQSQAADGQQSAAFGALGAGCAPPSRESAALAGAGFVSGSARSPPSARAYLAAQPGLIVLHAARRGTAYELELLRDPQAQPK